MWLFGLLTGSFVNLMLVMADKKIIIIQKGIILPKLSFQEIQLCFLN